jgi:hypothetical protein
MFQFHFVAQNVDKHITSSTPLHSQIDLQFLSHQIISQSGQNKHLKADTTQFKYVKPIDKDVAFLTGQRRHGNGLFLPNISNRHRHIISQKIGGHIINEPKFWQAGSCVQHSGTVPPRAFCVLQYCGAIAQTCPDLNDLCSA